MAEGRPRRRIPPVTAMVVFTRDQPSDSRRAATATSIIEMVDVIAAKKSTAKNATATTFPAGICANAIGSEVNASSAPAAGLRPKEKTMGKMTRPARIDTNRSVRLMIRVNRGMC